MHLPTPAFYAKARVPREAASSPAHGPLARRGADAAPVRPTPRLRAGTLAAALAAALVCGTEGPALAGPCEDIDAILDAGLGAQAAPLVAKAKKPARKGRKVEEGQ
jgi:hypothetical protein